ncbi:Sec-independent protein translocase protein TatB [Roseomonas sp. E05]|uniref:Sec-independent protein translocase protein TatB n=1 Tax=Roseomonas sp. E05 TaxID=3046310 RepID=UPI0024B8794A|nr:Sec-independent protein translocase protein TatB [Roseomonas sp. E05]MDJ0389808.1 Sec-independent protein translocase protein TatB [Roseomonas sp. E05]
MFDFAWSELALIAVVAVVVIGPKDLPDAIRNIAKGIQKLRRMAAEFQSHADELVREAKLEDVRDQIRDIRNFDLKGAIERNLDQDGQIRRTINEDPLKDAWKPEPSSSAATSPATPAASSADAPEHVETSAAPAFVPPAVAAESGPARPTGPDRPAEGRDTAPAAEPASGTAQTVPGKPATPNV